MNLIYTHWDLAAASQYPVLAASEEIPYALIAELTEIDGQKLVYEDILELDLSDVIALQAELSGKFQNTVPQATVEKNEKIQEMDGCTQAEKQCHSPTPGNNRRTAMTIKDPSSNPVENEKSGRPAGFLMIVQEAPHWSKAAPLFHILISTCRCFPDPCIQVQISEQQLPFLIVIAVQDLDDMRRKNVRYILFALSFKKVVQTAVEIIAEPYTFIQR